ncbi:MAG: SusC/RagA family TonB-linked outer membrane protein [Chitinophagaceae bacterium]|nr:MAG: SusC/RagA family TonB-linked outer membrane protein [Chitinophagaceae bacterium]
MRRFICSFIFILGTCMSLLAQDAGQVVSGTVKGSANEPLDGATVKVEGKTGTPAVVTVTDIKGNFTLPALQPGSYQFTFSYIGLADLVENHLVEPGKALTLTVGMTEGKTTTGEEVVVVGYGRTAKKDLTGAVKSLKSAEFNKGIINSPEEMLQGKISGVNVTSVSGEPGGIQGITIRGPGGVRTGSTPLYVVDGLALDNSAIGGATNPLSFLNPQDIESFDVLKDASATAIYGSRGANGVVLVTTKKGKTGFSSLNYNVTAGISRIANALPVFDAAEYKRQVVALGGTLEDFGGSTDWQDEITRTAFTQNHNLSMAGGANKFTYYASVGMQKQEGILKGNQLKRYTGRLNVTQKALDDRLLIELNLSANNTVNIRPDIGGLIGGALSTNPTIPAYDENGKPTQFQNGINPLTLLALEKDLTTINRVIGNISGSLTILKGLVYKINFGIDNSTGTRDIQSLANAVPTRLGRLATFNNYNRNYLVENFLTYSGSTGEHRYTVLAGHSYQNFFIQDRGTSINNFPVGSIEPIYNPGIGQLLTLADNRPTGSATENQLQSFFARANYQFKDRYLLTATFRADGSTKFGENNKYGYFPAFSAGWVVSKEDFFPTGVVNLLKVRGGWGETGNQEIPSKKTQPLFTSNTSGTSTYPLYPTGAYPAGTIYSRLANPDLQWEVSKQTDLGLDFELFRGKLSGTVDYFNKTSSKILLLVIPADPIQPAPETYANISDMEISNKGFEFDLLYRNTTASGFTYSVGGNMTFIKNRVRNSPYTVIQSGSASGAGLTSATINGYVNNEPIGTFFLREFTGFDQDGLSVYRDINGDGISNDLDRIALGSALPTTMFNAYGNVAYKGFDLAVNFNGISGNKIYDNTANSGFYKNLIAKGVNTTPEAVESPQEATTNSAPVSSRFLKDGRFFRLNNLSVGYSFNTKNLGLSKWVNAMRLSLTGQNLFVVTPYNGYDPEVNTNRNVNDFTSYGIDYLSYPKARSFLLSFNVTF